jgi:DNA-binding NarL/FixJ family response regulator
MFNQNTYPGIFNQVGYEFLLGPKGNIFALQNGQKIPFENITDKLLFIILDDEIKNNRYFQKEIHNLNLSKTQKRKLFIHCFLAGYDENLDYDENGFHYDYNKSCKHHNMDNCPYNWMCEKCITYNGVKLSHREYQIIRAASKGMPKKSIAIFLGVSIMTLNNQFSKLYNKINIHCIAELICFAKTYNII